jgi:molecular chaperone DnaK
VPQIEVTFEIDTDGVVHVSAKDLGTGKGQQIQVSASGGLSEDEIQGLIAEADRHATSDQDRRELVDLRNKADGLAYSTERALEEYAEHVGEAERQSLQAAIEKARSAIDSADVDALRSAVDELSGLSYQMTETLYSALGSDSAE